MPLLVENLTHTYMEGTAGKAVAVRNVSMRIEDGEFFGIIGHTGSGKSTLIQHFNALLQPTSGKVSVNGIDLADKKNRLQVRKQVGMVFQYPEYQLFEETVAKDIAFGPKNIGIKEEDLETCVRKAMEKVALDYDAFAEKSPFELSGGEKRRVALAGILAMEPGILVLDEPMAGLDPRGRKEILGFLRDFHRNGLTIVMVSHSMEDVVQLAQRVAVMKEGELWMLDTPQRVFAQAEELAKIGLDAPQPARFAAKLRARGLAIREDAYTMETLCAGIAELHARGGHHAQ